MTISKERLEELLNKFLNNLRNEYESSMSYYVNKIKDNPEEFLKCYYKTLIKDCMEERGLRSIHGYDSFDFPLRLNDFTKEELEYLKFYGDKK